MARGLLSTSRELGRIPAQRLALGLAPRERDTDLAGHCPGGSCIFCRASERSAKSTCRSFGLFLANRLGGRDLRAAGRNLRQRGQPARMFPTALRSLADLDLDSLFGRG